MKRFLSLTTVSLILVSLLMVMGGCSGSGKGGSTGSGSGTTVVSGKVTLSSSILSKSSVPSFKAMAPSLLVDVPRRDALNDPNRSVSTALMDMLNGPSQASSMSDATVDMYDADHPEWLYPIASGATSNDGSYSLSTMSNSSKNHGATYKDGDPIPAGNYTIVAYSGFGLGQKPIVAVQSIVKNFDGQIPNVDFEVLPSDVAPAVSYMFGESKSKDGSEIWGSAATRLPANSAIQITFSMPMWRANIDSGIVIDPPVAGKWSLSADWLTATYYLDNGSLMTPGTTYTITINGEDTDPGLPRITNVYGNPLKKTATGTFAASAVDTISPTVQWNSPTVVEMGSKVDVTQAFRIESNKMLDVNGISMRGTPSIGVKPGILFLGKNTAGLYVYEFMLGEPLMLDQSYSITVNGGKDLSGHLMNVLTGSISTKDAANTPGIDPASSADIQNMQAQVKSVFGKWVRAMNDKNLAQWQSVMSGEFYMEYDAGTNGVDAQFDINRDGRYSLGEFSTMLLTNAFPQWEYCGSTISGKISPAANEYINVVLLTMTADFSFKLEAANLVTMRLCSDAAPKETFYATVKYKNGAWRITRASLGIDTRDKNITKPNLIDTKLIQSVTPFIPILNDTEIGDGFDLSQVPDNTLLRAKFSWDAVNGAKSYVIVIADERDPYSGIALALNSDISSVSTNQDPVTDLGAVDVSSQFGLTGATNGFQLLAGGRYIWEVIGFGTATAVPDPKNPTDPNFIPNMKTTDLLRDIAATSKLRKFGIAGIYRELTALVRAGTNTSTPPVKYSPAISGYTLGTAFQATITIYTPNQATVTGKIRNTAATYKSTYKTVPFSVVNGLNTMTTTVTLYKGLNYIYFYEDPVAGVNDPVLYKYFYIWTDGGLPEVISIWEVTDDNGNTLIGDQYGFYKATGARTITLRGAVSDMAVSSIAIVVRNEYGPYYRIASLATSSVSGDNIFTTATMTVPYLEIYKGNNTITLTANDGVLPTTNRTYYRAYMGIKTDLGSVWVPPVSVTGISAPNSTIGKTADYSNSSDWNAVLDPAANYTVTVNGKFKTAGNGKYYASSDGAYANGVLLSSPPQSDGSGTFSIDVILYNGWNYLTFIDVANNYYYANVYTTTGKVVVLPTITTIDGNAYNATSSGGKYTSANCTATITGTSEAGNMSVNWNASSAAGNYNEYQSIANTNGTFSFVVPLAGPGVNNIVDIYDYNGRHGGVTITTTGACAYAPPSITVTQVKDAGGTPLVLSGSSYQSGTTLSTTISGTSNRPGGIISVRSSICGQDTQYTTTADTSGNWSISGLTMYGRTTGMWNYVYLQMANAYQSISIYNTNNVSPTLRLQITSVIGNVTGTVALTQDYCGYSYWDAGSSNTSVTINGISGLQNGTGNLTDPLNQRITFPITNGAFSIANVPVYGTPTNNNVYLYVNNDPLGYTNHGLYITSTNANTKPKFVNVTFPAQGATGIKGVQTITGTITDPLGSGFVASDITANVSACGTYKNYATNSYYQTNYGYLPMTLSGTTFTIPSVDFCGVSLPDVSAYISVNVYDNVKGLSHYSSIYVNYASPPDQYYGKPGAVAPHSIDQWLLMMEGESSRYMPFLRQ